MAFSVNRRAHPNLNLTSEQIEEIKLALAKRDMDADRRASNNFLDRLIRRFKRKS